MISSVETGREGEILACLKLARAGFRPTIVNFPGVDIVCLTERGTPFTVEVKSRTSRADDRSKYSFRNKSKGLSDWIAYAALDLDLVIFESGGMAVSHRRIDQTDFTAERMMESLNRIRAAYQA